jgi:hypothetical protein
MTAAQREVDEGRTPACQLALAINGELIALEGFGAANDSTRFSAMSRTKVVVAGDDVGAHLGALADRRGAGRGPVPRVRNER